MKRKMISLPRRSQTTSNGGLLLSAIVSATLLATALPSLRAQLLPVSYEYLPYQLDSGLHDNDSAEEEAPFSALIEITNTPILRVHFNSYNLGTRSYLTLISVKDNGVQRLDSKTMPQWQSTSALFNGPGVLVQLHVAPGEKGIFANVDQIVLNAGCGDVKSPPRPAGLIETLCGADSRVASTDFRVGRISGCTAWLVSNGAVLTAGHCSPVGGVFEVNVPTSTASGGQVASAPEDQYPVDTSNATFINNGQGDDWTVFGLQPNSTTGGRAHLQHGFFRMSRETPAAGSTIRVTGYGVDNTPAGPVANCCAFDNSSNCTHPRCNAQSRTLQTATGPFQGESIGGANNAQHTYSTDTEPANSGSPIIWSANGFAIGIHTNGGCNSDGSGSNSGTSFENNGLENALQNFPGSNTRYLDTVTYPNSPADNGTIFQPFHNLTAAVASVPSGGRISIVEGSYSKATVGNTGLFGTGNKAMTLIAPVGTVTIGD
jgi:V8-like Glu-specific endopeptidase